MRSVSAALAAELQSEVTTLATCWKVTLKGSDSPTTVRTFTDHDQDIVVSGLTYAASSGYTASDIATSAALNVDNLEVIGFLESPSISEEELLAGRWDYAQVEIFLVNYESPTDGILLQRVGHLGEVTTERGRFKAELRGLMQAYQTTIGEVWSPTCRANLGDSRCQVDLSDPLKGFTAYGTVESASADNSVIYDSGRTEQGPVGGLTITNISNANPGVVTLTSVAGLADGMVVMISEVIGPSLLNTNAVVNNLDATALTFDLGIDTSDTAVYPAYVSGGLVSMPGSSAGFFDGGLVTFTSGDNEGLSMEVKHYSEGQIVLHLPMPYPMQAGDTYVVIAGCDKTLATCRDRFDNVVNFRGEPYLPGTDRMVQVGRHDTGTSGGGAEGGGGGGETGGGLTGDDLGDSNTVAPGYTAQGVDMTLLNLPFLGRSETSFFISAAGDTDDQLSGYVVYKSSDGGSTFPQSTSFSALAVNTMGTCLTTLGDFPIPDAPPDDTIDTSNTVDVEIGVGGGTLSSNANARAYVNVYNTALIGDEIIQFRTATLIGANTYRLSNLYRGAWGTENAIGGHGASEQFVLLPLANDSYQTVVVNGTPYIYQVGLQDIWNSTQSIWTPRDDFNVSHVYKAVGAGQVLGDASPISFTNTGEGMRPFAPTNIHGARDGSNNLTISWLRRSRGEWNLNVNTLPWYFGDQADRYLITDCTVRIYSNSSYSTVVRTFAGCPLIEPTQIVYTAAQQVTDFGSTQATVYMDIVETKTYEVPPIGSGIPDPWLGVPARRAL